MLKIKELFTKILEKIKEHDTSIDAINTGLGSFQRIATHYTGTSSSVTYTDTLTGGYSYFIVVGRSNSTASAQNGLYLVRAHSSNSSILPIADSSVATISISSLTLTIQLTSTYAQAYVYRL